MHCCPVFMSRPHTIWKAALRTSASDALLSTMHGFLPPLWLGLGLGLVRLARRRLSYTSRHRFSHTDPGRGREHEVGPTSSRVQGVRDFPHASATTRPTAGEPVKNATCTRHAGPQSEAEPDHQRTGIPVRPQGRGNEK
jgi:hypothetical protein